MDFEEENKADEKPKDENDNEYGILDHGSKKSL